MGSVTSRIDSDALVQFGLGLGDGVADARDDFHGVEQQFLLHVGVLFILFEGTMAGMQLRQDVVGNGTQVRRVSIHQRNFPFHPKGGLA